MRFSNILPSSGSPDRLTKRERTEIISVIILSVAILTISLICFGFNFTKPYMGVLLTQNNQEWEVSSLEASGIAIEHGIKVGDKPLEINHQPASTFLKNYEPSGTVFQYSIQHLTVISGDGQTRTVSLQGSAPTRPSQVEMIISFFPCLIFWITGFYVFWKRPRKPAAILLCLCSVIFGLAVSANAAAERSVTLAFEIAVVATTLGPWLLLHFFLVLPEERAEVHNKPWIYLIYLPAIVTLILLPFIGMENGQAAPWFRYLRLIEIGVAFTACVVVAVLNYIYAKAARTRQQLKIILITGMIALIPFLLFSLLPETILGSGRNIIPGGIGILFIAIIPIGMGYAVVTQKMLDIDFVIRRGVVYGLITLMIAAIISAVMFFMMSSQESIGTGQEILIAIIVGAIATALFGPAKSGVEYLVDKFFYKDRYDYRQTLQGLGTTLNTTNDLNEVSRLIVGTAVRALNLSGACLFVKGQGIPFMVQAAEGTFASVDKQNQLYLLIGRRQERSLFPDSAAKEDPELAYLIPIVAGDKEIGFLCISQKVSRQEFSSTDIYLLQGVVNAASSCLRNALLVREVSLRYTWVSIASHELRAPLSAIVGYSDLLLKTSPPDGKQAQWLKNIQDNGLIISRMADDLLNVSRIQTGKISLKIDKVNIKEILESRVGFVQETTSKHRFKINCESDLPEVMADRDKLGQVIVNLLSNAVKYSPKGGSVIITAQPDTQNRRIIISVTDEGLGISDEDKATLFKTFHRIQRPETTNIRGAGLGLYIVKEWVGEMGGEVWLESQLNKGSTFYVSIPTANPVIDDQGAP